MGKAFHEAANIFPMMAGEEFSALKQDIAENGMREAIWLHPDGRIIDGRNRYRACEELGIAPVYRTWDGRGSLVSFVVSLNLHRRHLTSGQRAAVAVEMLPMLEAEARARQIALAGTRQATLPKDLGKVDSHNGESATQAAAATGTNREYVSQANAFQDGMEFQDWIVQEFGKIGFYIQLHASKRYQFERGEAVQRVEIKLDRGCTKSGRLSIEVGERTATDRQWVQSGIYRMDNSIFYVQGNYERAYLFDKRVLQRYHVVKYQGQYEESPRDTPTVRKFYMPFAEADEFCIVRLPMLQATEAKASASALFF